MKNTPIHIQSSGHGPDLVLLHGWAMHSGYFDSATELLRNNFRVHQVDLPGHGLSRDYPEPYHIESIAQEIVTALTPRVNDRAIYLGWSLGGSVASWLAAHESSHVAGLILVASNPCFVQQPDWPYAIADSVLQEFADSLVADYEKTLLRFLSLQIRGADNEREVLRQLRSQLRTLKAPEPAVLNGGLAILRQCDHRELLKQLTQPVLLLGGQKDTLVPVAALQSAAAQLANATLSIWETAGHAPFLSNPERFADEVNKFAEQMNV